MIETVVHVTTLEQWKSVLDVWFKQGYEWVTGGKKYKEEYFTEEYTRYLNLFGKYISKTSIRLPSEFIEYSEFMAQQKEDKEVKTFYVTQNQLVMINGFKGSGIPIEDLFNPSKKFKAFTSKITTQEEKSLLRYIGGDKTIEFKVKEQLYRLYRIDDVDDKVYMRFTSSGNPDWTMNKDEAFTAPLEEIKKWQTPAWEIEEAD